MVPGFFFPGEDTGKRFVRLPAKQMFQNQCKAMGKQRLRVYI